jgi:hypothetical protein
LHVREQMKRITVTSALSAAGAPAVVAEERRDQ